VRVSLTLETVCRYNWVFYLNDAMIYLNDIMIIEASVSI